MPDDNVFKLNKPEDDPLQAVLREGARKVKRSDQKRYLPERQIQTGLGAGLPGMEPT